MAQSPVTVRLRQMILSGEFAPDAHITEAQLAKLLDVSRTPVRLALVTLEHEGLVSGAPHRGFTVRSFSLDDIGEAIELRGTLEGMAARLVAESGLPRHAALALRACLEGGDRLLAKREFGKAEAEDYEAMNVRFHATIVDAANNRALANALALNDKVPFASAGAVAFQDIGIMYRQLSLGHSQHHTIVEALESGEGSRAEALMREHALIAKKSLNLLDVTRDGVTPTHDIPGRRLVRA